MNHIETGLQTADTTATAAVPKSTVTTAGDLIYATGNAAVTRLGIGAAGTVLKGGASAPSFAAILNADVDAAAAIAVSKLSAPYTTYTPTWASSGTQPAIGNGTNTAHYLQIGKLIHAWGLIAFGSTSTFGTGSYTFALPVSAISGLDLLGPARLSDNSAGALGIAEARVSTVSTMSIAYAATHLGAETQIGQLAPWTWAQSDQISWSITYEAA